MTVMLCGHHTREKNYKLVTKEKKNQKKGLLSEERSGSGVVAAAHESEKIGAGRVEGGEDSKAEGGPVDDRRLLLIVDSIKGEGNDEGANDVTLLVLVLDITNSGGGQEQEGDFRKDNVEGVRAVLLGAGEDSKHVQGRNHDDEAVPDREGSMDEEAIQPAGGGVVLLEVVENERDRGSGEEDGNEGKEVIALVPEREPDGVQDGGDHKVPANTVNNVIVSNIEPLVNDEATEKYVNS